MLGIHTRLPREPKKEGEDQSSFRERGGTILQSLKMGNMGNVFGQVYADTLQSVEGKRGTMGPKEKSRGLSPSPTQKKGG